LLFSTRVVALPRYLLGLEFWDFVVRFIIVLELDQHDYQNFNIILKAT